MRAPARRRDDPGGRDKERHGPEGVALVASAPENKSEDRKLTEQGQAASDVAQRQLADKAAGGGGSPRLRELPSAALPVPRP